MRTMARKLWIQSGDVHLQDSEITNLTNNDVTDEKNNKIQVVGTEKRRPQNLSTMFNQLDTATICGCNHKYYPTNKKSRYFQIIMITPLVSILVIMKANCYPHLCSSHSGGGNDIWCAHLEKFLPFLCGLTCVSLEPLKKISEILFLWYFPLYHPYENNKIYTYLILKVTKRKYAIKYV